MAYDAGRSNKGLLMAFFDRLRHRGLRFSAPARFVWRRSRRFRSRIRDGWIIATCLVVLCVAAGLYLSQLSLELDFYGGKTVSYIPVLVSAAATIMLGNALFRLDGSRQSDASNQSTELRRANLTNVSILGNRLDWALLNCNLNEAILNDALSLIHI